MTCLDIERPDITALTLSSRSLSLSDDKHWQQSSTIKDFNYATNTSIHICGFWSTGLFTCH